MPGQYKPAVTTAPPAGHAHAGGDLLAFLGVLVFTAGLTLLVDRTGQVSARLGFAGSAGLAASCATAWRRLRRPGPRRWRSGQVIYRSRRMTLVSAWGVEGQPPTAIEQLAAKDAGGPAGPAALPAAAPPSGPGGLETPSLPSWNSRSHCAENAQAPLAAIAEDQDPCSRPASRQA